MKILFIVFIFNSTLRRKAVFIRKEYFGSNFLLNYLLDFRLLLHNVAHFSIPIQLNFGRRSSYHYKIYCTAVGLTHL
jgi:hypothetical protein